MPPKKRTTKKTQKPRKAKKTKKSTKQNRYGDNMQEYYSQPPDYNMFRRLSNRDYEDVNYYNPGNLSIPEIIKEGIKRVQHDSDTIHNLTLCIRYTKGINHGSRVPFSNVNKSALKMIYISKSNITVPGSETKSGEPIKRQDLLESSIDKLNYKSDTEMLAKYSNKMQSAINEEKIDYVVQKLLPNLESSEKEIVERFYKEEVKRDFANGPSLWNNWQNFKRKIIDKLDEELGEALFTHEIPRFNERMQIIKDLIIRYNKEFNTLNNPYPSGMVTKNKKGKATKPSIWNHNYAQSEKILYKKMDYKKVSEANQLVSQLTQPDVVVYDIFLGERYNIYSFLPVMLLYRNYHSTERIEPMFDELRISDSDHRLIGGPEAPDYDPPKNRALAIKRRRLLLQKDIAGNLSYRKREQLRMARRSLKSDIISRQGLEQIIQRFIHDYQEYYNNTPHVEMVFDIWRENVLTYDQIQYNRFLRDANEYRQRNRNRDRDRGRQQRNEIRTLRDELRTLEQNGGDPERIRQLQSRISELTNVLTAQVNARQRAIIESIIEQLTQGASEAPEILDTFQQTFDEWRDDPSSYDEELAQQMQIVIMSGLRERRLMQQRDEQIQRDKANILQNPERLRKLRTFVEDAIDKLNQIINITKNNKGISAAEREQSVKASEAKIQRYQAELNNNDYDSDIIFQFVDNEENIHFHTTQADVEAATAALSKNKLTIREQTDSDKQITGYSDPSAEEDCPICMTSLDASERLCRSTSCRHWYHCSCLGQYISSSRKNQPIPCTVCHVTLDTNNIVSNTNTEFGSRINRRRRIGSNGIDADIRYLIGLR